MHQFWHQQNMGALVFWETLKAYTNHSQNSKTLMGFTNWQADNSGLWHRFSSSWIECIWDKAKKSCGNLRISCISAPKNYYKVLTENGAKIYAKSKFQSLSQQENAFTTVDKICQGSRPLPHHHQSPARGPNLEDPDDNCDIFSENFHPNLRSGSKTPSLLPDINRCRYWGAITARWRY